MLKLENYVNTDLTVALKEERRLLEGSKDIREISEDDKDDMRSLLKGLL